MLDSTLGFEAYLVAHKPVWQMGCQATEQYTSGAQDGVWLMWVGLWCNQSRKHETYNVNAAMNILVHWCLDKVQGTPYLPHCAIVCFLGWWLGGLTRAKLETLMFDTRLL